MIIDSNNNHNSNNNTFIYTNFKSDFGIKKQYSIMLSDWKKN